MARHESRSIGQLTLSSSTVSATLTRLPLAPPR